MKDNSSRRTNGISRAYVVPEHLRREFGFEVYVARGPMSDDNLARLYVLLESIDNRPTSMRV